MLRRLLVASLAFALLPAAPAYADAPQVPAPQAADAEDEKLEKEIEELYAAGQYDAGLGAAEKLVERREKTLGKEHPKTASALSDLGAMRVVKGDYPKAEPVLERAVAMLRKAPGEDARLATALSNLGSLYKKKGDKPSAEKAMKEAIALEEKGGAAREPILGTALANLGGLYMSMGKLKEAEKLLLRAVGIHEKAGPERSLLVDLGTLGALYRGLGQHHKSVDAYNKAMPLSERVNGPEHPETGRLLLSVAIFLAADQQVPKSEPYFQRAEKVLTKALGPEHPDLAELYVEWAGAKTRVGEVGRALELWKKGQAIDEKFLENALATGTEEDKIHYASRLERTIDRAVSFQMGMNMGRPEATRFVMQTVMRHKGRVLDATAAGLQVLRSRLALSDQRLLDELTRIRGELATRVVRGPRGQSVEAFVAETNALSDEADTIEDKISVLSAAFRRAHEGVTLEAVQAKIPKDAALIEFIRYVPRATAAYSAAADVLAEEKFMAYILRHEGNPFWLQVPVPASEVDRKVKFLRAAMQDENSDHLDRQFGLLYNVTLGRILPELKGVRHLILSPDSTLSLVPFSATVTEKGKRLFEDYTITYLSSGRDLLYLSEERPASRGNPVVLANPDYDAPGDGTAAPLDPEDKSKLHLLSRVHFSPLPGTAAEAAAIKTVLPEPLVRLQRVASETEIKKVRGPSIVHVATHGFFLDEVGALAVGQTRGLELDTKAPPPPPAETGKRVRIVNPMFLSAVALAGANVRKGEADDGILTAYEVSALDLVGTRLVVLSACETGVGSLVAREGVQGLRRALVVAGAETQVMSLWQVDDEATRDLMTSYYRKLFREGKGRGEAMREAQMEVLRTSGRNHPFYWASFIVSGAWDPLAEPQSETTKPSVPGVPPGGAKGCGCELFGGDFQGQTSGAGALVFAAACALGRSRRSRRAA